MLNSINNREIVAASIIATGEISCKYIEDLAQSQTLNTLKEYGSIQERIVELSNPSKELKEKHAKACMGFLAWDLAFNGKFDGNLQTWALAACGLLPKQFEGYEFMAEEIAVFSKNYVNYYASKVAK